DVPLAVVPEVLWQEDRSPALATQVWYEDGTSCAALLSHVTDTGFRLTTRQSLRTGVFIGVEVNMESEAEQVQVRVVESVLLFDGR
ncbi:hypothetical protein ABTK88_19535, partial [Acinetobacter baumannii]